MFLTSRVTVLGVEARAERGSAMRMAMSRGRMGVSFRFDRIGLEEEWEELRGGEQEQEGEGNDPEKEFLMFAGVWIGARGISLACVGLGVEFAKGESEERESEENKDRSERLHFGEQADPCTADPERDEQERADTADRGSDGGEGAGDEGVCFGELGDRVLLMTQLLRAV